MHESKPRDLWTTVPLPVRVGLFFAAFMALTHAGYLFAFPPYTGIGVFWPSAGFCLAALLLEARRAWPAYAVAIFVGELLGVTLRGLPLPVGFTWAIVASGEPLLSAYLLRPRGAKFTLDRMRDLLALAGVGAVLVPGTVATVAAGAAVTWTDSPSWVTSWTTWWFGDALGVLVVAPLALAWLGRRHRRASVSDRLLGVSLLLAMTLASEAMFATPSHGNRYWMVPGFLAFPILLWAAMRFELRGVTAAAAVFNVLAAYHTTRGRGFFGAGEGSALERLVTLQAYLSFSTLSSLGLAVALVERRRGERQLQDMIDNSTAVVFAKGRDHRYLFVNREFERVAQRPGDAIVGKTPRQLWPSGLVEWIERADAEVIRSRRAVTSEDPIGDRTFLSVRFPLCTDDGDLYAVCGMSTDITDRKQAEEALRRSEERLSLVVAATHDAIYDWDLAKGTLWRNARYHEVFGEDATGDTWPLRVHPDDRAAVQASLQAALDAQRSTWTCEYRVVRQDGVSAHFRDDASLHYRRDGQPARIIGALADVTAQRRAQEELRRANVELEHRVEQRTAELATAVSEMETFNYSISHDLRAPLRAIHGFGSVLAAHHAGALGPEGVELLARIRAASSRMAQLIDDLLSLARAGRAEVRRELVDLGELAADVFSELHEAEPEREVTIHVEPGLTACADPGSVRIVLENLLSNAWKFTSHHARAHIEVGRARAGDEEVYYVRDDGAGFDERYAAKLFQPFERLHGTTEFPGTGIGLATVHRIVGRHGGRVWATGAVERGATFYFTLPVSCPVDG